MTSITTPPTAPSRQDPSTFADRSDAWVAWLEAAATEFDTVAGEVNANAAIAAAAAGGGNATVWVSGGSFTAGDVRYSPTTFQSFRAATTHSGETTDPSLDTTNWTLFTANTAGIHRKLFPFGVPTSYGSARVRLQTTDSTVTTAPPGFDRILIKCSAANRLAAGDQKPDVWWTDSDDSDAPYYLAKDLVVAEGDAKTVLTGFMILKPGDTLKANVLTTNDAVDLTVAWYDVPTHASNVRIGETLGVSATTMITVGTGENAFLHLIQIANIDGTNAADGTAYWVDDSDGSGESDLARNLPIDAGEAFAILTGEMVLNDSDLLKMLASAASDLDATVCYRIEDE